MLPDDAPPENQHPIESARDLQHAEVTLLRRAVTAAFPPHRWAGHPIIVGVSGGADSVALVRLLLEMRAASVEPAQMLLAHCNYGLRGAESDADEEFVRELAAQAGVTFRLRRASQPEKPAGIGREAAWREFRYQYFAELAHEAGARYLLLAHTADDQIETVLLRLLRGSSLAGLRGIPRSRPLTPFTTVVRPLLQVRRQALRTYLQELGQPFRVDSSNESLDFQRNRLRNQLLPHLAETYSPAIGDRMLQLSEEAEETQALVETLAQPLVGRFQKAGAERLVIPAGVADGVAAIVVRTALVQAWREQGWGERDLTARHWHALAGLIMRGATDRGESVEPQSLNLPGNRLARRLADGTVWIESGELA